MVEKFKMDERMKALYYALLRITKNKGDMPSFREWKEEVVDNKKICALKTFQKNVKRLIENKFVIEHKNPKHKQGKLYALSTDAQILENLTKEMKQTIPLIKNQMDKIPLTISKNRKVAKPFIDENLMSFIRNYSTGVGSFENTISLIFSGSIDVTTKIKAKAIKDEAYFRISNCIVKIFKLVDYKVSLIKKGFIFRDFSSENNFVKKLIRSF